MLLKDNLISLKWPYLAKTLGGKYFSFLWVTMKAKKLKVTLIVLEAGRSTKLTTFYIKFFFGFNKSNFGKIVSIHLAVEIFRCSEIRHFSYK